MAFLVVLCLAGCTISRDETPVMSYVAQAPHTAVARCYIQAFDADGHGKHFMAETDPGRMWEIRPTHNPSEFGDIYFARLSKLESDRTQVEVFTVRTPIWLSMAQAASQRCRF